jgi:hypothetical protein
MVLATLLSLKVLVHKMTFHLLMYLPLAEFCSFQCVSLSLLWLLFLSILIFGVKLKGVVFLISFSDFALNGGFLALNFYC